MSGLLLKDFYTITKRLRSYLFFVLLALVYIWRPQTIFFLEYPILLFSFMPATLLSYEENESWHIYQNTLPLSRAQMVSEKYLLALCCDFAISAFVTIIMIIQSLSSGNPISPDVLNTLAILLTIGLLEPTLILPVIYKFGAIKARIVNMIVTIILCMAGVMLIGQESITASFDVISISGGLTLAIVGILFAASWIISVQIYKRREL